MMKKALLILLTLSCIFTVQTELYAQACWGTYTTDGDEIPCGDPNFPCCTVWKACNGTGSPCNNYDPDYSATGGCDLSCTPIDSGVLFLLLGGAAFGGTMIMRRREHATQVIR